MAWHSLWTETRVPLYACTLYGVCSSDLALRSHTVNVRAGRQSFSFSAAATAAAAERGQTSTRWDEE
jgi:hypothetical protein